MQHSFLGAPRLSDEDEGAEAGAEMKAVHAPFCFRLARFIVLSLSACLGRVEGAQLTEGTGTGSAALGGTTQTSTGTDTSGGMPAVGPQTGATGPGASGNLTFLGRTLALDPNAPDHVALSWAGVAAGTTFEGTGVVAHFVDTGLPAPLRTSTGALPTQRYNTYRVYVDGKATNELEVGHNATQDVVLADSLAPGSHTLWLVKRSEAWMGVNGLLGFSLPDGGRFLPPPPRPKRTIEILGASADVAYGVLCSGADCTTDKLANCQDVEKSWGNLVGQALDAEVVNLSYSGHGLEWSNGGPYPTGYSPPEYYVDTDITAIGHPWDASSRQVDAVLFGLFANDWHYLGGTAPPQEKFVGELLDFIATIRRLHPQAWIYLTMSATMELGTRPGLTVYLTDTVNRAQARGDTRVRFFAFPSAPGLGCSAHPDVALQKSMADMFLPIIKADLNATEG